jgi:hypothetical protein
MESDITCGECGTVWTAKECPTCFPDEADGFADIDDDTPLACGLADPDYCESCQ